VEFGISGGSEREVAREVLIRPGLAMRASRATGLGAGAESLVNDRLDGARASATFGAAAQTSVDLLGIARQVFSGVDSVTDVVVADEVAGTDDHENGKGPSVMRGHSIFKTAVGCKRKKRLFK
jgi:hypothetical protein